MNRRLEILKHRIGIDSERLNGLSPLIRLQGGYSYLADGEGRNIRSKDSVSEGDSVKVYVSDGLINATVTGTEDVSFLQ